MIIPLPKRLFELCYGALHLLVVIWQCFKFRVQVARSGFRAQGQGLGRKVRV